MGRFVAGSAAATVATLVVLVALTSISPPHDPVRPLLVPVTPSDGREATEPLRLSALDGEAPSAAMGTTPGDLRVILVKVPIHDLRAAAEATGRNTGQYAVAHPEEPSMALFAFDAASTHLGCSVGLAPTPGHRMASWHTPGQEAVVLMDVCHQGMWDVLAGAAPRPGTPAPTPLAVVPIVLGPGDDPQILHGDPIEQPRTFAAFDRGTFRLAS